MVMSLVTSVPYGSVGRPGANTRRLPDVRATASDTQIVMASRVVRNWRQAVRLGKQQNVIEPFQSLFGGQAARRRQVVFFGWCARGKGAGFGVAQRFQEQISQER